MSGYQNSNRPDDDSGDSARDTSRRRLLKLLGGASAIAAVSGCVGTQATEDGTPDGGSPTCTPEQVTPTPEVGGTPIVLGGQVNYWLGLTPFAIESQQNPTLQLVSGRQYSLIWINVDGNRHQWQIEDETGTVLQRTEPARRIGATRSVTFEATEAMARYRCQFHPEAMQGTVELGEGFPTPTPAEATENRQTGTPSSGETVDVAVGPEGQTLRFVPETVEISVGDTVRWTARSPGHNVSCKPEADPKVQLPDGAEPFATYEGNRSFAIMQVGDTFEHTFTVPGTYVYVCVPHADQGMIGQVIVSE